MHRLTSAALDKQKLKAKEVQRKLKNHPLVSSFRQGEYGEGGAGVTIVELEDR